MFMHYHSGGIGHQAVCAQKMQVPKDSEDDGHLSENDGKQDNVPDTANRATESGNDEEADYGYGEEKDSEGSDPDNEAEEDLGAVIDLGPEDGKDLDIEDLYGAEGYAQL